MSRTRSADGKQCLRCGASLEYGALIDTVTGQRGWACDECDLVYSSLQLEERNESGELDKERIAELVN